MQTWLEFRKPFGCGSASVAVMSGYHEIRQIPYLLNDVPVRIAKALTGTRHGRLPKQLKHASASHRLGGRGRNRTGMYTIAGRVG